MLSGFLYVLSSCFESLLLFVASSYNMLCSFDVCSGISCPPFAVFCMRRFSQQFIMFPFGHAFKPHSRIIWAVFMFIVQNVFCVCRSWVVSCYVSSVFFISGFYISNHSYLLKFYLNQPSLLSAENHPPPPCDPHSQNYTCHTNEVVTCI